jgi:hypothetical protein
MLGRVSTALATGLVLAGGCALAAVDQPVIDGDFADWAAITGILDPAGDTSTPGVDFLELKTFAGTHELLVYVRVAEAVDWRQVPVRLFVDADGDASTGVPLGRIGYEYDWSFESGYGSGNSYSPTGSLVVRMGKGTLLSAGAPIEPSTEFEFAIPYPRIANGTGRPTNVRLAFYAFQSQDRIPAFLDTYEVAIPAHQPAARFADDWQKISDQDIRIVTWNVYQDGPFDPTKDESVFGRQLAALNPEIIHFQELYAATTPGVRAFLQRWIPAPPGRFWFVAKRHDCITASLFPITRNWFIDNNLIVEIDTSAVWGTRSIMVNAHTPCCENEAGRITETTTMLRWIESAWESGILTAETPLLLIGDFNTGTATPEIMSMRIGRFPSGSNRLVPLTGDGSPLADLSPVQIESRETYTWRGSMTGSGGRLDYIYYPHTQLWPSQSFVLAIENLSEASRQRFNLNIGEALVADHKIVGGDFRRVNSHLGTVGASNRDPSFVEAQRGNVFRLYAPWHYSSTLGWFWSQPPATPDSTYWLYHDTSGWLASSTAIWPWVWDPAAGMWRSL